MTIKEINKLLGSNYKTKKEFKKELKNRFFWNFINVYKKLSEEFISEFQNEVNWYWINKTQKLSQEFKKEFEDKLKDVKRIVHYVQKLEEKDITNVNVLFICLMNYNLSYQKILI